MMQWTAWTLWCLLLFRAKNADCGQGTQCSLSSVGTVYPVQGFLERFDVGLGCAARESGPKETHVITVARASHFSNQQVTVLLRPLSYFKPSNRLVVLVLSSQHAVRWRLEVEGLPLGLLVLVQASPNSTVEPQSGGVQVQLVPLLPWRPRALLHWSLQRYRTISSLTHSTHANRVYIRLGEDHSLPRECHLQSLFLSRNYLTSEVQPQEVQACVLPWAESDPEVHVIKLWSAGSGLCGSLQVEVSVSLLPPVANRGTHKLVLILSSAAPVNWALTATGIRGHIFVYASNSVTPLYPPRPDLTMTSMLSYDLLSTSDLLEWANDNGFPKVTSYTEADLANRFVIRLAGGGTDQDVRVPVRPSWMGESRLRQWLTGDEAAQEAISVQCQDGRLSVAVDRRTLQARSLPLSAVTLRDPGCQAWSNGSHFLLAFPVISCGTEGLLEGSSPVPHYKNTVLLWRNKLPSPAQNETELEWTTDQSPVAIHFSCKAPGPNPVSPPVVIPPPGSSEVSGGRRGPSSPLFPGHRMVPRLTMQLFVTEHYEKRQMGPCIITAENRVYVQILAEGHFRRGVEVQSCVVSPQSNSSGSPSWPVILNGCSQEPTFILTPLRKKSEVKGETPEEEEGVVEGEDDDEDEDDKEEDKEEEEEEEEEEEKDDKDRGRAPSFRREVRAGQPLRNKRRGRTGVNEGRAERDRGAEEQKEARPSHLRFSFVLRPIFNNSIHFLHCSLRQCSPAAHSQSASAAAAARVCHGGVPIPALIKAHGGVPIPALIKAQLTSQKCENRNLSRPMLVTSPLGLAKRLPPPSGQRNHKSGVSDSAKPKPLRTSATGQEIDKHRVMEPLQPSPLQSASGVGTGPVLGIVFAAFLMGICLMGALWCVYSRTGTRAEGPQRSADMGRGAWNHAALLEQSNTTV
ncbi:transforming growth factor beta receptor type 3 isoform X2 [Clupea harengus]|uniref:Transforming growth factor beta receptor type 3 isoform X2 n=1 Tax=Clupea harengus TaxID=7950 RepID=A0A6P8FYV5_CLUHA|nr:transforming growth factor beta receptor type 3 isoform X2 [Clupea harengus]